MTYSAKRRFGNIGENLACQFLMKRGFTIIKQNYLKPWGEIDIIATKGGNYRFVEVKSVSQETSTNVIHETAANLNTLRPEENMHPKKLQRLYRTIETYLGENSINAEWQLDLVTVKIDELNKKATIEILENIVGE